MFGNRHGRGHGQGRGEGRGRGRGPGHGRGRGAGRHGGVESTLDRVRPGEHIEIAGIEDEIARAQAIRLGLGEGSNVTCVTKLPCGPVILKCGMQEIAVGRGLAQRIDIRRDERLVDDPAPTADACECEEREVDDAAE